METFDILLIIAGLGLLFWRGNFSLQGIIDKGKELLAKNEKGDAPKIDLPDHLNLPTIPNVTPAPIDSNTSFSFAELYNRFKDGIQTSDWIWLLRNAVPLVIWLLPLILEKGKAEAMAQEQKQQ